MEITKEQETQNVKNSDIDDMPDLVNVELGESSTQKAKSVSFGEFDDEFKFSDTASSADSTADDEWCTDDIINSTDEKMLTQQNLAKLLKEILKENERLESLLDAIKCEIAILEEKKKQ
jgi:hypothetical protein